MSKEREFMRLFDGLRRAYGIYTTDGSKRGQKVLGKVRAVLADVTPAKWAEHLQGKNRIGIVPIRDDATCLFGVIDVDDYSISVEVLERRVRDAELPLVVTRSKSGGAHLWCFCSEPISAEVLRDQLTLFAIQLGFPGAEVFPKQKKLANTGDVGNWINMPYFDMGRTMVYGVHRGKGLSADEFLARANEKKVSQAQLLDVSITEDSDLEGAPPCLQAMAKQGVPEGSRNNTLLAFGVYAKLRWEKWEDKIGLLNNRFIVPPLDFSELAATIKSLNRKDYFYTCDRAPLSLLCNKAVCREQAYGIGGSANDPGVQIESITKVDCDPPHYFAQVNGHRVELPSSEYLISQTRFQNQVFQVIDVIPRTMKGPKWVRHINDLMRKADIISAPADAGDFGQFEFHLRQFCTARAQARERDELLMGKPWQDGEGHVWFRSSDLFVYLDRQRFRTYRNTQIWALLKERIGAQHRFIKLKGVGTNIWGVPSWESVQTEEFSVPVPLDNEDMQ